MNRLHSSISMLVLVLSGCATNLETITTIEPARVEYLDGKFKVCRENCPVPTPKELDDATPMEQVVAEMVRKSMAAPMVHMADSVPEQASPSSVPQNAQGASEVIAEQTAAASQHEIYFDFGMSQPNAEGENELRKFEESIRGVADLEIDLVGRTDDIGTDKFNRRLARKRALNVASWIRAHGIKAQIKLSTKAECCRAAPYDKREPTFKEKRRVTIISRQTGEGQMKK